VASESSREKNGRRRGKRREIKNEEGKRRGKGEKYSRLGGQ